MEVRAVSKYIRISPQKARLVADLIRGKDVDEALSILKFTPKKAARLIDKTLRSAIANAEQTKVIDVDSLYVKKIYVDQGPTMKRWMAKAMGRASRILKRTSHITVVLDER
ncbi:MAG: 50S ribosomal protein L22 [Deltaproteobacteria bacterium]|nr:MAG: 50S ribosomal protein L22 [Deltaproteobacteria bacterium]RLB08446.1 MAG: 50S ribosomal protein L22 [Deltaproteobacteria bacterium]